MIDAVRHYDQTSHANIHRGVYVLSEEATAAYEHAHVRVAQFINADWDEIVFTKNTTEALNLVAYAWGLHHLREGDEVVLTQMEHHSNLVPWQQIARRTGARVQYVRVDGQGHLDMEHAASLIGPRTKMVTVAHVSNVLGTVNPVHEFSKWRMRRGRSCVSMARKVSPICLSMCAPSIVIFSPFLGTRCSGRLALAVYTGSVTFWNTWSRFCMAAT